MYRFLDNCKSLQKTAKKGPKLLILGYFSIFIIFGPYLLIFNQTFFFIKFQKYGFENLKNWAQKC